MLDLNFDFKLGKLNHYVIFHLFKDNEPLSDPYSTVCFAAAKSAAGGYGNEPNNKTFNRLKFYPWVIPCEKLDMKYWVNRWLQITMGIPFVKRRILEYTQYSFDTDHPKVSKVNTDNYVLIDFTCPMDEPFVVAQLLRVPQEAPGSIHVFAKLVEQGIPDLHAWIVSLYYRDTDKYMALDGHNCCNDYDPVWWQEFLHDQEHAKSVQNRFKSNVLGGPAAYPCGGLDIHDVLADLQAKDLPKHYVAVYGSLRKGMGNHSLLKPGLKDKSVLHSMNEKLDIPAKLYDTGCGFPALVPDAEGQRITVEVYKVNDQYLQRLDELEGYPDMYDRTQVMIGQHPSWVYFQKQKQDGYKHIQGDWVKYARQA